MPDYLVWPGLFLLGVFVGTYGTMIGAGGGFILVPMLLLLYPNDKPETVTSISLAVVFFNALSGTGAYIYQRRVDFLAANSFALATIPGAVAGALVVTLLPRNLFDALFAGVLLFLAVFLLARPAARVVQRRHRRGEVVRTLTDRAGDTFAYSYNLWLGVAASVLVGFLSSLLGIGGGVIHVPIMVQVLLFPAHVATATSHYVLTISALTGTVVHLLNGNLDGTYDRFVPLAIGVLIGAQIGARLSLRVGHAMLIRLLAVALLGVAVRLLVGVLL
jgi:uncharacterized membrane protein YfcA